MRLQGVNTLMGPTAVTVPSADAVESAPPGKVPVIATDSGIEWFVAALGLSALAVLILFKMAGFQAAIAIKAG